MRITKYLAHFVWNLSWIPQKLKRVSYKHLSTKKGAPDAPFSIDFFGMHYEGNLNNSIEFNIFYYGAFEKPLLFFLRDTFTKLERAAEKESPENLVFCDVGANIGQHSIFMSTVAKEIHSFEPYSMVNAKLKHHITLNSLESITLHELGLSDKDGAQVFFAPTGRNQGIGSFDADTTSKGNVEAGKLQLVKGDFYFQKKNISNIGLVKIDVEGYEKLALAGLVETIERNRPILVCEVTYGKQLSFSSRDELLSHLPCDYNLYCFDTRKFDGSKARRKDRKARKSGKYQLIPFTKWRVEGQDDVIACPNEKLGQLSMKN
ncbi:MAG TPA: FkbM family methyltransferase [Porticoccaceae bacterium]|nr:FkbM family methyltransferase [Gammaproteobacteria bacterium]HIL59093.1 FkbM family methyltransferase [Porticoccaceae bacterium]